MIHQFLCEEDALHRADINPIAIKSQSERLEVQNEGDFW
jgi:hypothetical protein